MPSGTYCLRQLLRNNTIYTHGCQYFLLIFILLFLTGFSSLCKTAGPKKRCQYRKAHSCFHSKLFRCISKLLRKSRHIFTSDGAVCDHPDNLRIEGRRSEKRQAKQVAIIIDVTAGSKVRTNVMLCQFSLPKAVINPAETTTTASTPHA